MIYLVLLRYLGSTYRKKKKRWGEVKVYSFDSLVNYSSPPPTPTQKKKSKNK
jgi:hypothetical protein